jgi:hypothetical protein
LPLNSEFQHFVLLVPLAKGQLQCHGAEIAALFISPLYEVY